jgi:RecA/RadA recombinase
MSLTDRLLKAVSNPDSQKLSDRNYFKDKDRIWAHSGCPELESNLGGFGFPIGITEVAGTSKSGKTTIAMTGLKNFQKQHPDGFCIILSSEERENDEYARRIGVDTDNVVVIRSRFVEDLFYKLQHHFDAIEQIWVEDKMKGKPAIFVMWDSVGATNSRAELDTFKVNADISKKNIEKGTKAEFKHAKMADFAKSAKMCMKAVLAQLYEKHIIFVAINHLMDNLSSPMGGKTSTGGSWLEYLPTLRLKMERVGWERLEIDGLQQDVAQVTRVKVEKNDFGSRRQTDIEILLGYGIILSKADIGYGVEKGIIKKEGAKKMSYLGKMTWSTRRDFFKLYEENHKLLPLLHKKIADMRHDDIIESKGLR